MVLVDFPFDAQIDIERFLWIWKQIDMYFSYPPYSPWHIYTIGNNLKTSKKWKIQGSWNGTIVLINKKITKVICFKCYNHKTMTCNN
jgi:hypothetical protein